MMFIIVFRLCFCDSKNTIYFLDIYRFFKLSVRRNEFRDIFKEKLNLHQIPALNNILYWEDVLFPIAEFYLKKERWDEAIEIYKDLEAIEGFDGEGAESWIRATEKKEI